MRKSKSATPEYSLLKWTSSKSNDEVYTMSNTNSFPQTGFVRLSSILAPLGPIPVSKATWWAGVKSGRHPQPVELGVRITAWRVEDIFALLRGNFLSEASNER
jgi:prophage regulatory protein